MHPKCIKFAHRGNHKWGRSPETPLRDMAPLSCSPTATRVEDSCRIALTTAVPLLNTWRWACPERSAAKPSVVNTSNRNTSHVTMQMSINGNSYLSRVVRKPAFCICENKDADQLRRNREADQRLCFRHMDSAIPLLSKSEISSL